MKIKNLTVGPILGATTTYSARIFGRAKLKIKDKVPKRAHGVLRFRQQGTADFSAPIVFKMNPNFDMTGIGILNNLNANTLYQYQMGWFFADTNSSDIDVEQNFNWDDIDVCEFKTASDDDQQPRVIVAGSCRYALKMFNGAWFDDRGDKAFASIGNLMANGDRIDQLIMSGDQIYADDLGGIGAATEVDEFNKRYRTAFTTPHMRKLMSQVPTYMTLDDHEIEDNWPDKATGKDWVTKFPAALHAYATYQASHSPLFAIESGRLTGTPTHLWYSYQDGCCDIFVCDTRTERQLRPSNRQMLGPNQMQHLLQWLVNGSGRVKIIVSSVPFYEHENDDKWHGFIEQRDLILETIKNNNVKKVIVISGDVHACMASQLELGDEQHRITSVVSSAFFWPYPHYNRSTFKLTGEIKSDSSHQFRIVNPSGIYPTDAFSKLHLSPDRLTLEFVARKGELLEEKVFKF